MPMAPATCGPSLTGNILRRACGDCCLRRYRVDPYWGIPRGTPPLIVDSVTGMVRPFSSLESLTTAIYQFIGFSPQWFPPGEDHLVWVHTCGWIEMQLNTPRVITVGTLFAPVDTGTYISDSLAQLESPEIPGIWTAVEACFCQTDWVHRLACPPAAGDPVDESQDEASDTITQRTVLLSFGNCCDHTAIPELLQ